MQDHDQETEVVEEDGAATKEIVEENENDTVIESKEIKSNSNKDKEDDANFQAEQKDFNNEENNKVLLRNSNINLQNERVKISPLAKRIAELQEDNRMRT